MNDRIRVMVSTNAFGMGIDKPNVRFVVHLDLPDSLEAYFQEAGRGGRDGKQSWAALLYDSADLVTAPENLSRQFPPPDFIKRVYHALGNYFQIAIGSGKDVSFDFDLRDFCQNYSLQPALTLGALKILEKEGYIFLSDLVEGESRVYISSSKEDLYKFQVEQARYDSFIKTLLRSYSGLFTDFVRIQEEELARRMNTTPERIVQTLKTLQTFDLLRYQARKNVPQLVFLVPRLDKTSIALSPENYSGLLKNSKGRLEAMIHYVSNNTKCRSIQLLAYFGEKQKVRCGHCDVCIERNKVELSELEFDTMLDQIKPLLKQKPCSLNELVDRIPKANEDQVIKVIQWLLDNGKIKYEKSRKLSWI
jgi:ATP-dependent DNA helicase RecQ